MARFLSSLSILTLFAVLLGGCADHMLSDSDQASGTSASVLRANAPTKGKLRHPQVLEGAISKHADVAGKYGVQNAHLFVAFAEYEADGVTRRVLDSYGVTRRILQEYGVTRRVLQEYGITRRVLEEYGITRRVMEEYGGLTFELLELVGVLEANGVTRRILDEYGVTRRHLEQYAETFEPEIEVRVRVSLVRPGVTIAFVSDFLDTFLEEIADDPDIELVEPDVEIAGAPLYLKDGVTHGDQMIPWNIAAVGGLFTQFEKDDVDVFLLDSGVFDRDLNVVEAKDFTMLFQNRNEETWDDSQVIEMPFFDPGEMGDPEDRNGHGTHAAGTIGAEDNSKGVKGLAPEARIHSLKVLTDDGRTDITTVVSAIDYVTDFKQKNPTQPVVANLSLGMDLESTAYNILDEAVKRAIDFGVVVVVSAGNDYADASTYSPAHVYEAITVGATNRDGQMADFSNYGSAVDIFAPGDQVVSLTHLEAEADRDENIVLSGTSMAAPHVTAAAALYLALNPYASPAEVKQALINAANTSVQGAPQGTTNRGLNVSFADDGATKAFSVTKSEWDSYNKRLKLEGEGPRVDRVTLTNAARGTEIATLTIDDEGKWKYQATEPAQIPCVVDFSYLGGTHPANSIRQEVSTAPGSCDPLVRLTKAQWKEDDQELILEGYAASGTTVVLTDAQLGTEIVTLVAGNDHKFKAERTGVSNPPCRVSATNGNSAAASPVEDVDEDDCSGGMGMSHPLELTKAEWDPGKLKLKIEGQASAGAMVTLLSKASGNSFATVEADGNGRVRYQYTDPSIIPCTVRGVSSTDGSTFEMPVTDRVSGSAPSKCERAFELQRVEWDASNSRIKLKGVGPYGGSVLFKDTRTGDVIHTATLSSKGEFEDELKNLQGVPCSLLIEHQGLDFVTFETPVLRAESICEINLVFNLLQYTGVYNRLSMGGMATAGTTVTLSNADTGVEIASAQVAADRTWRKDLNLEMSGMPPCRVEATASNGDVLSSTVSPMSDCNPAFVYTPVVEEIEQNPYSFIQLSRSDYNGTARRLRVSGEAYEFLTITVTNPATGEVLGSMTNDDRPEFDLIMTVNGTIPCTVEATLDGRTASRVVSNAPDNCDDRAYIEEAKWRNGSLELTLLGPANDVITLSRAADGRAVGTVTLNSSGSFENTVQSLLFVPCVLRATTSGGRSMDLEVDDAPLFCDATAWLDFDKAAWRSRGEGELILEGEGWDGFGNPNTTLTFHDAATGQEFHSEQTDDGEFQILLRKFPNPPCNVEVRIAGDNVATGASAILEVDGTCGN